MKSGSTKKKGIFFVAFVVSISPFIARAAEPSWPLGFYKYAIINQDVKDVLTEFGKNVNVPVQISDQVQSRRLRGPFPITTPSLFLKNVCDSAGLAWYYDGVVLHISSSAEISSASINVPQAVSSVSIPRRLEKLGILDRRYPVRSEVGSVFVSGPPAYIAMIRQSIRAMGNTDDNGVRVFRAGREGT